MENGYILLNSITCQQICSLKLQFWTLHRRLILTIATNRVPFRSTWTSFSFDARWSSQSHGPLKTEFLWHISLKMLEFKKSWCSRYKTTHMMYSVGVQFLHSSLPPNSSIAWVGTKSQFIPIIIQVITVVTFLIFWYFFWIFFARVLPLFFNQFWL